MGAKKGLKRKLLMPHWENDLRNQENGYGEGEWQKNGHNL